MIEEQQRIDELARAALEPFGLDPDSTVTLCNVSENHTYRVEEPSSGPAASHCESTARATGTSRRSSPSSPGWMRCATTRWWRLRRPCGPRTDAASSRSRCPVSTRATWLCSTGCPAHRLTSTTARPRSRSSRRSARSQRGCTATFAPWRRPADFARPRWDYDYSIGPLGHWGPWRDGLGIGPDELALLERLDATVAARLERYGQDENRFGLVHADFRLANLLVDGDRVVVIDFDDCGFSWYAYDFATTITFIEDDPRVPEWREAWVEGYRSVADLEPAAEAELETFVMMRRLLIVAWIGSHHTFAPEAAELGVPYTNVTCELAENYLSTHATR